jgi:hypothetical protein
MMIRYAFSLGPDFWRMPVCDALFGIFLHPQHRAATARYCEVKVIFG